MRKYNFRFKDIDLLMFKYLFESSSGVMTFNQIKENFYPNLSKGGLEKKLWKYGKAEYIQKFSNPLNYRNDRRVFAGGPMALKLLKNSKQRLKKIRARGNTELCYISPRNYTLTETRPNLKNYAHDIHLNDLRFQLENYGADNWIDGKILFKSNYKNDLYKKLPDAAFENDSKNFAIEYESNLKQRYRYLDIIEKYKKEDQIYKVLYINADESISNRLKNIFTRKNIKNKFYEKFWMTEFENIFIGDLRFYNSEDNYVDLADIF